MQRPGGGARSALPAHLAPTRGAPPTRPGTDPQFPYNRSRVPLGPGCPYFSADTLTIKENLTRARAVTEASGRGRPAVRSNCPGHERPSSPCGRKPPPVTRPSRSRRPAARDRMGCSQAPCGGKPAASGRSGTSDPGRQPHPPDEPNPATAKPKAPLDELRRTQARRPPPGRPPHPLGGTEPSRGGRTPHPLGGTEPPRGT